MYIIKPYASHGSKHNLFKFREYGCSFNTTSINSIILTVFSITKTYRKLVFLVAARHLLETVCQQVHFVASSAGAEVEKAD